MDIRDFIYQVEDIRNGVLEEVHVSILKFYYDEALNTNAIMPHVLAYGSQTDVSNERLWYYYDGTSEMERIRLGRRQIRAPFLSL